MKRSGWVGQKAMQLGGSRRVWETREEMDVIVAMQEWPTRCSCSCGPCKNEANGSKEWKRKEQGAFF